MTYQVRRPLHDGIVDCINNNGSFDHFLCGVYKPFAVVWIDGLIVCDCMYFMCNVFTFNKTQLKQSEQRTTY